jgi:aryl-alcohol dehydrogenase-like predicted oxidoreductase
METRALGELEVTVVGLGCNNFGGRIDEQATRAVVDAALDAGVTFFDTADIYGNKGGSETLLGKVLGARREQIVLATKFGKPMDDGAERRGSRSYVLAAADASLRRLQTDRIDLYQHHELDPGTPLEETVGAVAELVQAGKVRAYGTSNYTTEAMRETARLARELGVPYVSEQSEYSWLARDAERELIPASEQLGLGFIPFFPLASGLLTGKVRRDRPPAEGTRLHGRELADRDIETVERLAAWGDEHGASLLEIAVGGLLARPSIASVIAGATKAEQVRANVAAAAWRPSAGELAELRSL